MDVQSVEPAPPPGREAVWRGWSARRTLTRAQAGILIVLLVTLAAGLAIAPARAMTVVTATSVVVFLMTTTHRVRAIRAGWRARGARIAPPPLADADLPRFSVLVALYREANVVPRLLESLGALDYPRDRFELLLLVEHDDPDTAAACEGALPPGGRLLIVPPGEPRTKPRALNHGLGEATGDLLTIYDAEDRPDSDQLRKAASALAAAPADVACLQARLDFYNARQNLLTRLFTCDYSTHFALYLAGVERLGHPMPLGGTSTHFRAAAVREVGGWDAWNVTEDCELGMRLAAAGHRSGTLDSVTWEEAVPGVRNWIRQRSRWIKGFAQTGLVLLRAPLRTARAMGPRRYFAALTGVAGVPFALCAQLVFWLVFAVYVGLRLSGAEHTAIDHVFPEPFLSLAAVSMLGGNFAVLLGHLAAVYQQRHYDLVRAALLLPLYWALASIAAWKAVAQLVRRPHFWEKTSHGHATEPAVAGAGGDRSEPAIVAAGSE